MTSNTLRPLYTDHALTRMHDRGVYKQQVRRALERPEKSGKRSTFLVNEFTTTGSAIIQVVFTLERTVPLVNTVIRLGKLGEASQRAEGVVHDDEFDLAYLAVAAGRIARTVEVGSGTYFDLNSSGEILGVEVFEYSRRKGEGFGLTQLIRFPYLLPR